LNLYRSQRFHGRRADAADDWGPQQWEEFGATQKSPAVELTTGKEHESALFDMERGNC